MSDSDQPIVDIPEAVSVLLEPVSGDSATGTEAANEEEYFKLDMEIGKVNPDYDICIELAQTILKEKSKDLRVATWLCFAWYRSERVPGLKNGLMLLLEMLKAYGEKLFPPQPVYRQKALNFLNSSRFVRLLEKESVDAQNSSFFIEIEPLFQNFVQECQKQFPDTEMEFKEMARILEEHVTESRKAGAGRPPKEEAVAERENNEAAPPQTKERTDPQKRERISEKKAETDTVPEVSMDTGESETITEKSAVFSFKKILRSLYKKDDDQRENKAFIFGLSRILAWGRLVLPPEENLKTPVAPPDASIRNTLREWVANEKWKKVISAVELNLLDDDSGFKYWLDAQRYVVSALEHLGGDSADAAEEVKFHLAALVKRHPGFSALRFNDDSPFSDEDTLKWIDGEIQTLFGSGKRSDDILPPILGEDYEPINDEYRQACKELPENFEVNVNKMQEGIEKDTRRKGRFLRLLNLANFCLQAKEYTLAKVHLSTLLDKIDSYQLTRWEPALSVAVWESTYLVNTQLLQIEKDADFVSFLDKQQKQLFSKIGSYDGVLALKLAQRTKRKGD